MKYVQTNSKRKIPITSNKFNNKIIKIIILENGQQRRNVKNVREVTKIIPSNYKDLKYSIPIIPIKLLKITSNQTSK